VTIEVGLWFQARQEDGLCFYEQWVRLALSRLSR